MADLSPITDLVQWAQDQEDPEQALHELSLMDRANNPQFYAEMDAAYIDVDAPDEEDDAPARMQMPPPVEKGWPRQRDSDH